MPNIQPGIPGGQAFQAQQAQALQKNAPVQRAEPRPAEAPPSSDQAKFQTRTTGTERAQRLTSDQTRLQIHQLIQKAVIQVPEQKPGLQLLNRPAMSSALAETLASHQPADAGNAHAQMAGGSLAAASHQKVNHQTEDSVQRNSVQSGKRARKEEQEGEFSSLTDSEGGMSQGDSSQDQRSDAQKQKQVLLQKKKLSEAAKPNAADFESFTGSSRKKTLSEPLRGTIPSPLKRTSPAPPKLRPNAAQKPASPKDEWTL